MSSLFASIGGVFGHSQEEEEESDMALRATSDRPQRIKVEDQQKNAPAEGKTRKALGDIGNFACVPPSEGRHLTATRTFSTKILANALADAEKKQVKPLLEEAANPFRGGKQGTAASVVQKKKGVEDGDEYECWRRSSGVRSPRKKVSLTAVLATRSKAANGVKMVKPNDGADAVDATDELAAAEYVGDIYEFYKHEEDQSRVDDYMSRQPEINSKMRTILVDWLVEVHSKFDLMPETLYLTVNIMDRYLSAEMVSRRELQLVGIGSMLIACKYEEVWAPQVKELVCISAGAYNREEVLGMEKSILGKLDWQLTVPTTYVFLVRYIKACVSHDEKPHLMENMAFFLAELGMMHYSTMVLYSPSLVAACAVYAARCTLKKRPRWTQTLKNHTGYAEDQLLESAKLLVRFHWEAAEVNLKAVYRKFSDPTRYIVARMQPARIRCLRLQPQ